MTLDQMEKVFAGLDHGLPCRGDDATEGGWEYKMMKIAYLGIDLLFQEQPIQAPL